jgi:hypothetical protein
VKPGRVDCKAFREVSRCIDKDAERFASSEVALRLPNLQAHRADGLRPRVAGAGSMPDRRLDDPKQGPLCEACHKPTDFVTTIPRVTEPGRVRMFQCATCGELKFVDLGE